MKERDGKEEIEEQYKLALEADPNDAVSTLIMDFSYTKWVA